MPELCGTCEPEFEPVKQAFIKGFDDGLEVGASVAVFREGEPVVDLWAGFKDEERTAPWEEDTVTILASTTKIPTGLCAHICIDRGLIDIEAPVVKYWPEFGKHGKDAVLVKHFFTHTSGVVGFDPPIPWNTFHEWGAVVRALEDQVLWWEPGTRTGYHGHTYGFLVGELVRRVSGLTPGKFLSQEITSKIDADLMIGFPLTEVSRLTMPIRDEEEEMFEEGSVGHRAMNCLLPPMWEPPEVLTCEIPGGNGIGNARSVAKIGSVYANHGEMAGHRFLSEETLELIVREHDYRQDEVMEMLVRRGLGLGLSSEEFRCPSDRSLHWGGQGGSICIMDLDSRTSLGYVPNKWLPGVHDDPRNEAIRLAYNKVVGQ